MAVESNFGIMQHIHPKYCELPYPRHLVRFGSEVCRLLAIIVLLVKIWKTKSCSGVSAQSQILFFLVYITRYLDIFTVYISLYNTGMKIAFVSLSLATVYLILVKFKSTSQPETHVCRAELLIVVCAILALLINLEFTVMEICWAFSYYSEAVAILPQIFHLHSTGSAETFTPTYLFLLGLSRGLFHTYHIIRINCEPQYFNGIQEYSSIVQTVLYTYFIVLCIFAPRKTSHQTDSTAERSQELFNRHDSQPKQPFVQNGFLNKTVRFRHEAF